MHSTSLSTAGSRPRNARRTSRRCFLSALAIGALGIALLILSALRQLRGETGHASQHAAGLSSLLQLSKDTRTQSVDWRACLEPTDADKPMTKEQFLQQAPARLRLEHIRLSPLESGVGVTVVIAYDARRLSMLDGVCATWGGHISAAVYLGPVDNTTKGAASGAAMQIDDIFERATAKRTCALDVALYSEVLAEGDPWMGWLFPVNALRSRALLVARTELVLVLDGDMLIHSALHSTLGTQRDRYKKLVDDAEALTYHVLPALQAERTSAAYQVALGSKAGTVALMEGGQVTRFNPTHDYPQGCTDYDRWRLAKAPYRVEYCRRYEPWGIVSRRKMPWFDVRFRGYGRNKIVFTAALNASGFAFEIDSESFIVHRPHEASSGSFAFSSDAQLQGFIVGMHLEQAKKGVFTPVLDEPITRCRAQLPWWQ
mmetsp:Transcript_20495/g.61687  ORF Transcript_20495/g.61687 Transcript_20495/m.61687 type:complete len:429 (+) Transcript_20495:417-1703(+)